MHPPDDVVGAEPPLTGESQMTRACATASSPATLLRRDDASVRRAVESSGTASSAAAGRERVVEVIP